MMNLFYYYPRQYWNTSVLIVNAGASENSTSDYSKLAVAIGNMKSNGINVSLPNINKSDSYFTPDKNSTGIYFDKSCNSPCLYNPTLKQYFITVFLVT